MDASVLDFNPGDWVEVTGGLWKGYEGAVQNITYIVESGVSHVKITVSLKDVHETEIPVRFLLKKTRPNPFEEKSINLGTPVAPLEIVPYFEPEVGQIWAHKKNGFVFEILHVRVDQFGVLRDRVPDGDCFVYRCRTTGKLGVRLTKAWEIEMRQFEQYHGGRLS